MISDQLLNSNWPEVHKLHERFVVTRNRHDRIFSENCADDAVDSFFSFKWWAANSRQKIDDLMFFERCNENLPLIDVLDDVLLRLYIMRTNCC